MPNPPILYFYFRYFTINGNLFIFLVITLTAVLLTSANNSCDHLMQLQITKASRRCLGECCKNDLCEGAVAGNSSTDCIHLFCDNGKCSWINISSVKTTRSLIWVKKVRKRDVQSFNNDTHIGGTQNENSTDSEVLCGDQICLANEHCEQLSTDEEQCLCSPGFERNEDGACMQKVTGSLPCEVIGPSTVQLPEDSVQFRVACSNSEVLGNLTYYWEVLEGGGFGTAKTYEQATLSLLNLKVGTIRLRVTISNTTVTDHRDVSLIVLAEKKSNRPPKALIRPSSPVRATEGSEVVLDGEGSSDEDGDQLEFEWKLLNGPAVLLPAMNTAILRIDNLVTGVYDFGLTVKDKEGASDHGTVEVIVTAKRDDPPKAQISECGESVGRATIDVRLPRKTLLLCANASTDDYGITSYQWFRIDNLTSQLPIDYSGSLTPVLSLTNLQPNEKLGPYIFKLEVGDVSQHVDTAIINILVNKAVNQVPVPIAGANQTIQLPTNSAVLNGNVKDDGEIISYLWTQISGPNQVEFLNQDKSKCTVSGFVEGVYRFRLNVTDDGGLSASDDTFVNVTRNKNEPPVARSRNVTVLLPSNFAVLNGSESTDDAGIVRYLWTPHDDVPACIMFLGDSMNRPVALLNGLIPGVFLFDLTVADHSDEQDTKTITLTVNPGEEHLNSVEMYMEQNFADITYRLRHKLKGRLSAALASQIAEADIVDIHFTDFAQDPTSGRLRVVFHSEFSKTSMRKMKSRDIDEGEILATSVIEAYRAVKILRNEANMIAEFHIDAINTLHCVLDCTGHGVCSNFSKQCECDRYWMHNLYNYALTGQKLDCSWSVLYFGICVIFLSVAVITCITVRCTYFGKYAIYRWTDNQRTAMRRRRKRRYRRNGGDSSGSPQCKERNSSYSLLMGSESLTSDSENETVSRNKSSGTVALPDQLNVELRERPNPTPFIE